MGLYVNNVSPQTNYVIQNGILNAKGANTITIASWSFGDTTGGLGALSLTLLGNFAGGVPTTMEHSPSYTELIW